MTECRRLVERCGQTARGAVVLTGGRCQPRQNHSPPLFPCSLPPCLPSPAGNFVGNGRDENIRRIFGILASPMFTGKAIALLISVGVGTELTYDKVSFEFYKNSCSMIDGIHTHKFRNWTMNSASMSTERFTLKLSSLAMSALACRPQLAV